MACVALTSLIATIELQFLQPTPRASLHDRAPIKSFVANLASLLAILREESSGAVKDLEIQTRDFALKAEDDIEMQLWNFLMAEDREREHLEKASEELLQTLRGSAEIAAELLKIITREIESCVSEREKASVALTILITKFKYYFFHPIPTVSLDDGAAMLSFLENLSSLQACLLQGKSNGGAAIKKLETKIRNFALKAEDDIEIQLSNFLLAKYTEHEGEASQELHRTLREAAEIAAELLKIINKEKEDEREREMACFELTSLRAAIEVIMNSLHEEAGIKCNFLEDLSTLQDFLREECSGGATTQDLKTKIRNFALKAEYDIQIQLSNFFQAKEKESQEEASRGLYQAWQEASENATELLKIITKEKEDYGSARQMASNALYIFMKKFHLDFLHPTPIVLLDDKAVMISFFEKLSSLQAILQRESSGGAAIKDLETKIRDFVLKVEDDIETQIKFLIQAKYDIEYQEQASQLNQTLQEAAKNAEELLMIFNSENECDDEIEMACVALSSLMGTIKQEFLDDEAVMKSILVKISSLQAFLQKESRDGAAVKDLETKIKNFALRAGDGIKIQLNNFLQARDTEYQEKFSEELHQTMREAAESAAELLKIINSRSNEVDEANETQTSNSWLKHASYSANVESDGSSQRFLKLEGRMVVRHHDYGVITNQLLSSYGQPPKTIISIVGMVGIGKTMLARNVYEDPLVASHFHVRGWSTIPQDYNKIRMLCDLLKSITPTKPNLIKKGSTPDELEMQIRKCLLGRRYLIVLDNILSNQAWIDFIQCVPNDIDGSCILLTTSHFKREYYRSNYIHHMTLLDPEESWNLFCNILPIKEHMAPKFENIKNDVVEKCDGLPQLIVEVAKRLSKCNNIQQGWKKIEKELESLGILDRNALYALYNPLPHHLKVCFLYFGIFPKRYKIQVKTLIRLWIAEGFVKPLEHKELYNQAYGYLQELIDRSLLLIENQSFDGKTKTCRMHSALHSFCVGEAQKHGILCAVNIQQHSGLPLKEFANSCRWLSFCSHSFDYYVLFSTNISRSIFFFHDNPEIFVPPKLLRVMAFDPSVFLQRVPVNVRDLVFLRYLSITQWFEGLDHVVSNNPYLLSLVVSSNESQFGAPPVHLPSSIWEAPQLRHLELGDSYRVDSPSMVKENLQSLSWVVRLIHCRKEVYDKLPNIKKLKISLKDDDIEASHTGGSYSNPIILDYLDYLEELEKLTISISVGCVLTLTARLVFPSQLKKLRLSGTNLSERDLTVIGMLPQLMVLKLENAFQGTVWKVSKGGFRRLRFLLLEDIKLKQWEWETCDDDNFPVLEHIVLRFCYSLKQIPGIFKDVFTLKLIVFEECCPSLVASAKKIQYEHWACGDVTFEIKIMGPEYDTDVSLEDDLASLTDTELSVEDDLANPTLSE